MKNQVNIEMKTDTVEAENFFYFLYILGVITYVCV